MGLAVPVLAIWARLLQRGRTPSPALAPVAGLLILAGLAFALDVGSFHISLTGTKVANATFIGNVAPILTVVGGALFFREQPSGAGLARAGAGAGRRLDDGGYGGADAGRLRRRLRAFGGDRLRRLSARHQAAPAHARRADGDVVVGRRRRRWRLLSPPGCTAKRWSRPARSAGRSSSCSASSSHATGQGLTSVAMGRAPVALVALVLLAQPPFSALIAWIVLGEAMAPTTDRRRRDHSRRRAIVAPRYGFSHPPLRAERNAASMTRMLAIASSIGNSSGASPSTAREKASPCRVY